MELGKIACMAAVCAALSACGETIPEQSLFGAGVGASAAAFLDKDIATGALVGAAGNVAICAYYSDNC